MELIYIKVNGEYYRPQAAGVQDPNKIKGRHYPVCIIKKLLFGRWQIDYYDEMAQFHAKGSYRIGDEDKPNVRVIISRSEVQEIKWFY